MNTSSSLDKAIDLLFHLHRAGTPQGVTDAARALGQPKSSVHRLAATLSRRGLLERDGRGRMRMGAGMIALGLGTLERDPLLAVARPVLGEASRDLGETVFLTAPRGGRILVLDKVEGSGFLRAAPVVGQTVPAHATAVGKLMLAFAPESLTPPDESAERFTPQTLRAGPPLQEAVADARQRGYAVNHGEWIEGLSVVAAPIFGSTGALAAALAVAATSPRIEALGAARVAKRIVRAARRVEARLRGQADQLPSEPGQTPDSAPEEQA